METGKEKRKPENEIVETFVNALGEEHRMLVVLKKQLYGGSWDSMLEDLNNRLDGKPYVFKLVNRINEDIERINDLKTFEQANGIDLSDYINI
jgi:hypothetical protein